MYEFDHEDAWILLAVKMADTGDGASLLKIIRAADFINTAVPMLEEINSACQKLRYIEFIEYQNSKLSITQAGEKLIENIPFDYKKPHHPYELVIEISKQLCRYKLKDVCHDDCFSEDEEQHANEQYHIESEKLINWVTNRSGREFSIE